MRLNTAIAPTALEIQSNLGVIGGDLAGYPNGRRPGDDVVDITLRVAMGVLFDNTYLQDQAPARNIPFSDGSTRDAADFLSFYPYLNTPYPGSPDPRSTN